VLRRHPCRGFNHFVAFGARTERKNPAFATGLPPNAWFFAKVSLIAAEASEPPFWNGREWIARVTFGRA